MTAPSDEIKIEKGVPLPRRPRMPKLPLESMEIGDSFAAPEEGELAIQALRQRVSRFSARSQKRFSVMKVDDNTHRVYRVK